VIYSVNNALIYHTELLRVKNGICFSFSC